MKGGYGLAPDGVLLHWGRDQRLSGKMLFPLQEDSRWINYHQMDVDMRLSICHHLSLEER